jgi:hypothetical protein
MDDHFVATSKLTILLAIESHSGNAQQKPAKFIPSIRYTKNKDHLREEDRNPKATTAVAFFFAQSAARIWQSSP